MIDSSAKSLGEVEYDNQNCLRCQKTSIWAKKSKWGFPPIDTVHKSANFASLKQFFSTFDILFVISIKIWVGKHITLQFLKILKIDRFQYWCNSIRATETRSIWEGSILGSQFFFENAPFYILRRLLGSDFSLSPLFLCQNSSKPVFSTDEAHTRYKNSIYMGREHLRKSIFFWKCSFLHFPKNVRTRFFIFIFVLLLKVVKAHLRTTKNVINLEYRSFTFRKQVQIRIFCTAKR